MQAGAKSQPKHTPRRRLPAAVLLLGLAALSYITCSPFWQSLSFVAQPPSSTEAATALDRRQALMLGIAGSTSAAGLLSNEKPAAALSDENRIALFQNQVTKLNNAADWYLFEIGPLIFPSRPVPADVCRDLGPSCPDVVRVEEVATSFNPPAAGRAVVTSYSTAERSFQVPMRTLATGSIFDPDAEDFLQLQVEKIAAAQARLGQSARLGDVDKARENYAAGLDYVNAFFDKVNSYSEVPVGSDNYLTPLPQYTDLDTLMSTDRYWQRRQEKWLVKKKVDQSAKASKTARFYAKSIYGDDAVSWDPRGDSPTGRRSKN